MRDEQLLDTDQPILTAAVIAAIRTRAPRTPAGEAEQTATAIVAELGARVAATWCPECAAIAPAGQRLDHAVRHVDPTRPETSDTVRCRGPLDGIPLWHHTLLDPHLPAARTTIANTILAFAGRVIPNSQIRNRMIGAEVRRAGRRSLQRCSDHDLGRIAHKVVTYARARGPR